MQRKNWIHRFVIVLALGALLAPAGAFADEVEDSLLAMMDGMNASLAAEGADYRAVMADYVTGDVNAQGNTVIANDVGNKRLSFDFVPFDSRRAWGDPSGGITYAIDTTGDAVPFAGGLTQAQTDAAIVRATNSWDGLSCSNLPLVRNPDFGIDIGLVAGVNGFAFADVQHAGWRDLEFAGGTIGVTFTFGFCAPCAPTPVFTDINNDKRGDTALREIYYDPFVGTFGPPRVWADDGVSNIDVETVALHEIGHGLSQAHFGKVFLDNKGNLKFAPEAVMNAVYVGPRRGLLGTDNGGHCANWANWPSN